MLFKKRQMSPLDIAYQCVNTERKLTDEELKNLRKAVDLYRQADKQMEKTEEKVRNMLSGSMDTAFLM